MEQYVLYIGHISMKHKSLTLQLRDILECWTQTLHQCWGAFASHATSTVHQDLAIFQKGCIGFQPGRELLEMPQLWIYECTTFLSKTSSSWHEWNLACTHLRICTQKSRFSEHCGTADSKRLIFEDYTSWCEGSWWWDLLGVWMQFNILWSWIA